MASRVLIVDDEPKVLRALTAGLDSSHDTVVAGSASEARDIITSSSPFDMIIADELMPGERGHELLIWCRYNIPATKRCLLTAIFITDELVDSLAAAGEVTIFEKPWKIDSIEEELKAANHVESEFIEEKVASSKQRVLFVKENSDKARRQFSELGERHYDSIVFLDQPAMLEHDSVNNPNALRELVFELELSTKTEIENFALTEAKLNPMHTVLTASPATARELMGHKFDPARISVLAKPCSNARVLWYLRCARKK